MGNKKLIGQGLFLLVLLVAGYFGYRALNDNEGAETEDIDVSVNATEAGRRILALLDDLKTIQLDGSIFSDLTFLSLADHSVEILPEPQGRPNPFRPIGQDDLSLLENSSLEASAGIQTVGGETATSSGKIEIVDENAPDTTITDLRGENQNVGNSAENSGEEGAEATVGEGDVSGTSTDSSNSILPPPPGSLVP